MRMPIRVGAATVLVVASMVGAACSGSDDAGTATTVDGCAAAPPADLRVEVDRTIERAPDSYTQGLVVVDGRLFESGGRYGESTLRELDPATGEQLRRTDLDDELFAEGLAVGADGDLVQLTWKEGTALVWDPDTFEATGEFTYDGEGWGLTTLDDGTLVMSDGSDMIVERDPEDFAVEREVTVQRVGGDTDELNELEFDGESVWANRYGTDELLRIDPECWTVDGVADLSALRTQAEQLAEASGQPIDVTNGIAHLPGTDRYLVTGKWWPVMYEVRFVPT